MKKIIIQLLITVSLFFTVSSYGAESISCLSRHTLVHGNFKISAYYRFIFHDDNEGVLTINGESSDNGAKSVISRQISFDYIAHNNEYRLTNRRVYRLPLDNASDEVLINHFPRFFLKQNESLNFNIKKNSSDSYIISFVATPLFYCYVEK
ncbi:hypothetical protein [Leminorella grimontii]|uniref:hypothetical protein n=1 Tax=Leminorella grimontii TaxID=82981 RepID=UPI00048293E0|nr:hypothetical protein [Leminorella grimontii]VFS56716.1 Uncharacterised protein [Leminorella grimontii]